MTLGEFSHYGYFVLTVFLTLMLWGYIFHLYRAQKKGTRDYEKYSRMALDDDVTDELVETKKEDSAKEDSKRDMEG
jgi:cytochrome c oxidase cbb3-type subunit IV